MQIASVAFYLRLPARGKDRLPSGRPDFMPVLYVFGNSVDYTKQSEVLYSGNFPIYPEVFFFFVTKTCCRNYEFSATLWRFGKKNLFQADHARHAYVVVDKSIRTLDEKLWVF